MPRPRKPANPFRYFNLKAFNEYVQAKLAETLRVSSTIHALFSKSLVNAIGAQGVSGNANEILYVAARIAAAYQSFLEWNKNFDELA